MFYQQQMLRRSRESGLHSEGQDYVSHESQGQDYVSQESEDVFITCVCRKTGEQASDHNSTLIDIDIKTDLMNASSIKPEMAVSPTVTVESQGLKVDSQQTSGTFRDVFPGMESVLGEAGFPGTENVLGEDTKATAEILLKPEVQLAELVGIQSRHFAGVAKTSQRVRPKLSRMDRIHSSSSSSLEGSR